MFSRSTNISVMEKNWHVYFLLPALLIITAVSIFPFLFSVYLSFQQYNPVRITQPSKFVGLGNFVTILKDPIVWNSLRTTLSFVVFAVSIEFIFGFAIALLFNKEIPGKNIIRGILLIPMVLTPVIVGLIWKYLLNDTFGVINIFSKRLEINFAWYNSVGTALITMVLIDVWQWTPFIFLILLSGLVSLPMDVYESAKIDGASSWGLFYYLTLPLMKRVILIAIILRSVDAIRIFDKIWVLTRGGPSRATEVLSILIFKEGFLYFNLGYAAALSFFFLAIVVVLSFLFIRIAKFEV